MVPSRRRTMAAVRVVIALLVAWGLVRAGQRATGEFTRRQHELAQRIAEIESAEQSLQGQPSSETTRSRLRALQSQRQQLTKQRFDWRAIRPRWLLASGAFYLAGLAPLAVYWHRVLRALGQSPSIADSIRAYYLSHLGKYVPGKALVVIMRTGLVAGPRVAAAPAVAAVFIETLTMMASGAALAALILALRFGSAWLILLGVLLAVSAGAPTWPPLFRWIVGRIALRSAASQEPWLRGLTPGVIVQGWCLSGLAWVGVGLSLWAVIQAIPTAPPWQETLAELPLWIATSSLALVAGFVSLLPGGAGIRELIITEAFSQDPRYGAVFGFCAAVLLRIVWLLSELAASAILYPVTSRQSRLDARQESPP